MRDMRTVSPEKRSFEGTALRVRRHGGRTDREVGVITHGLPGTYGGGCRCADCRKAWRLYNRKRPNNRISGRTAELAATYVRLNHPRVWARLREQAEREVTS